MNRLGVVALALAAGLLACKQPDKAPAEPSEERSPAPPAVPAAPAHDADVIVVGGGLAGLSTAYGLESHRVVVLEKEDRLGGRVRTEEHDGVTYEQGALFAYDASWLPQGASASDTYEAPARVGISIQGKLTFGDDVEHLIRALGYAVPSEGGDAQVPHEVREALFGIIHPGPLSEYVEQRQRDWLASHPRLRRESGNRELVDALASASHARIELGATVTRVTEQNEGVEVQYDSPAGTHTLRARAAVIATPANVAAKILGAMAETSPVRSVRYAAGTVATLFVRPEAQLTPFHYVVAADGPLNGVFASERSGTRVLTVYYGGGKSAALEGLAAGQLAARVVQDLNALGIVLTEDDVTFADSRAWPSLGTIIRADTYEAWGPKATRPSQRIFLAGDYTHWDAARMPYGMHAAVESGRRAARAVSDFLGPSPAERKASSAPSSQDAPHAATAAARPYSAPSQAELEALHRRLRLQPVAAGELAPLVTCDVFAIGGDAPRYLGSMADGNVSPYGVVLRASRDRELARRLMAVGQEGLWEYSTGYYPTGVDSALVLDGLLAAEVPAAELVPSLERMRERYYQPEAGAFIDLPRGRAEYWVGPNAETTALTGYLMQRLAPKKFAKEIAAAARYLEAEQQESGAWAGKWFTSNVLGTYYATRFLAAAPGDHRAAITRATAQLAALQRDDGSVGGQTIDTAAAALTWLAAGDHPQNTARARQWLAQRVADGVPAGEGFFHLWFDDVDSGRTFFHCKDGGQLASAWARLALAAPAP